MDSEKIPVLPGNTGLHYLDEGAANIVYNMFVIYPKPATPQPAELEDYGNGTPPPTTLDIVGGINEDLDFFDNKLLRVRKDLHTTFSCAIAQSAWARHIAPLFPEDQLVNQSLVNLREGNIIARLNKDLEARERSTHSVKESLHSVDPRPIKRQGIYLADDDHGLLVTAMIPGPIGEEIIQFKPKWLAQSPSAPENSLRCRQCAHVARKNAIAIRENEPVENTFCPLDLVSSDYNVIYKCAEIMLHPGSTKQNIERFARWIQRTTLLRRLRDCQVVMDVKGVVHPDLTNENILVAMTLRDCSVFVRLPANPSDDNNMEARIGDLDLKSADKADYWRYTERVLIEEGWYTGTESTDFSQPLTCSLSRDASDSPTNVSTYRGDADWTIISKDPSSEA